MPRRAVFQSARPALVWLLLATLAALGRALPAPQDDDANAGPLPFLQFTKGGIRVNFGGYHAQAGLGGLLTGSRADGGLHASAGTPSGAHASAGLGGSLDGGPAGGLHARAGLGNGGPEAEAGLGGTLAGPQPRGELYAGSSAGNYAAVLDRVNGIEGYEKSKNIQVISRPKKASDQAAAANSPGRNETPRRKGLHRHQQGLRRQRRPHSRHHQYPDTPTDPSSASSPELQQAPTANLNPSPAIKPPSSMTFSTSQSRR